MAHLQISFSFPLDTFAPRADVLTLDDGSPFIVLRPDGDTAVILPGHGLMCVASARCLIMVLERALAVVTTQLAATASDPVVVGEGERAHE